MANNDRHDIAAIELLRALSTFLVVYRESDESGRRAALRLVSVGLKEMGELLPENSQLGGAGFEDGGDAG